jgi:predicted lipoprotein with Yx(FWY)xxD motif
VLGQGKGDVWFLAEPVMPNLVIMRAPEELMGIKYLADGRGRTLYMNAGDVVGSATEPPIENCDELCQEHFEPFQVRALRPVTSLEPNDLAIFVRADGAQQVSFKGQPLYLSRDEAQSGQMLGAEIEGFSVVLP